MRGDGMEPARLGRDLLHQRQRHLLVGLVLEAQHRAARVLVAHDADEEADGAVRGRRGAERGDVDRLADETRARDRHAIDASTDGRDAQAAAGIRSWLVLQQLREVREHAVASVPRSRARRPGGWAARPSRALVAARRAARARRGRAASRAAASAGSRPRGSARRRRGAAAGRRRARSRGRRACPWRRARSSSSRPSSRASRARSMPVSSRGLPDGRRLEARVLGLGASAGESHVAGPGVALVLGAADQQQLDAGRAVAEHDRDGGSAGRCLGGNVRVAAQGARDVVPARRAHRRRGDARQREQRRARGSATGTPCSGTARRRAAAGRPRRPLA